MADAITTSRRERALWLGATVVVAAIYGSLPFLGRLTGLLGNGLVLGWLFGLGFGTAILATVLNGVRDKGSIHESWVALAVGAVYLTAVVRLGLSPLERTHLFEYGIVAVLIYEALRERAANGRPVAAPALIAILGAAGLGWLDELLQLLAPGRVYDPRDVWTNALAALLAVSATGAMRWARRLRER